MASVTKPATVRKPAPKRTLSLTLTIRQDKDTDSYAVVPVRGTSPAVAVKAYELRKLGGDKKVYHLRRLPEGHSECDCKGFQSFQRCKHLESLCHLGMLPEQPAGFKPTKAKLATLASQGGPIKVPQFAGA